MINFLAITACVIGMVSSLACALGKLRVVFMLNFFNGCVFVILNSCIALSSREQAGVGLLIIPSVWMIGTSVLGLRNLSRAKGKCKQ